MKSKVGDVSAEGEQGDSHPNSSNYYDAVPLVKPAVRQSEENMAVSNNKIFISKFYPSN